MDTPTNLNCKSITFSGPRRHASTGDTERATCESELEWSRVMCESFSNGITTTRNIDDARQYVLQLRGTKNDRARVRCLTALRRRQHMYGRSGDNTAPDRDQISRGKTHDSLIGFAMMTTVRPFSSENRMCFKNGYRDLRSKIVLPGPAEGDPGSRISPSLNERRLEPIAIATQSQCKIARRSSHGGTSRGGRHFRHARYRPRRCARRRWTDVWSLTWQVVSSEIRRRGDNSVC